LEIDGEEFWNIDKHVPVRHYPVMDGFICPSDWRFREDLIWLKRNCQAFAGAWKLKKKTSSERIEPQGKKLPSAGTRDNECLWGFGVLGSNT